MKSRRDFVTGLACGGLLATLVGVSVGGSASARPQDPALTRDSDELARLYDDDQADRRQGPNKAINALLMLASDRKREARVKAMYEAGEIRTGKDYQRAAMVLQHAATADDHLLAHEFCVVALIKGEKDARWLAAAAEDRFLMNINRPQRFGTQYRGSGLGGAVQLYEVGSGVTDALRREFATPTLAEAKAREAEMSKLMPLRSP